MVAENNRIEGSDRPRTERRRAREGNLDKLRESSNIQVTMQAQDRNVIDPAISHGKLVIRGRRVPVTIVIGSLANGMTFEEIQHEYDLTADDIRAALRFVGELAQQETFHPLPAA
jgi:uncharacterized protein (DUF433 family)